MLARPDHDHVCEIATCALRVSDAQWAYAHHHQAAIDWHWQQATISNPGYFNGAIHLVDTLHVDEHALRATLLRTDFKSYLYWRETGFPEARVLDGFGSALIRSRDGDIFLGHQSPGNINSGLVYLPGGFIDARDADARGDIDIAASIAREMLEETGLGTDDVAAGEGFYLTRSAAQVSLAQPYLARLGTRELKQKIDDHIKADPDPELAEIVVIRHLRDLEGLAMARYARVLVSHLLRQH